eukprot:7677407-Lingulodinium_polyedra.AAC.1
MAVRHALRTKRAVGKKLLVFCDNLVFCCAFEKGRARAWGFNSICRRLCGYLLGGDARLYVRH